MDLMDSQPEFTKAIWDYLDILVNDNRLARAARSSPNTSRSSMRSKKLTASTATSSPHLGIESNYSTQMAIAACCSRPRRLPASGRRQKYFKDEFLVALEILHRGDLRPEQLRGSWAGAFGPTQFMPTAFKRYAVDATGTAAATSSTIPMI
jgi:membrane-bound lytic murein transglycosylase B